MNCRGEENARGEELRKSMSRDPRVRPKSAIQQNKVTVTTKHRPSSAIGKQTLTSNYAKSSANYSKSPRVNERASEDLRNFQNSMFNNGTTANRYRSNKQDSQSKSLPNETSGLSGIIVNSWLDTDKKADRHYGLKDTTSNATPPTGTFLQNYLSQKLDKAASNEHQHKQNKSDPVKNSFSSFLEAQYEEDYSVLALSEDLKKRGNQGFFLEGNDWPQNYSQKQGQETKLHANNKQNSRDNILRESLEQVVKEEAKQNGHSEPDKDHVGKKVSAMFDTLDPSNLESILGKERYERLIKNFEESEEIVDGVSSASGPGWLKDSSEDSQLETFGSHKHQDDNVVNTLSTHRSDPSAGNVATNIQIEISEPYKDYDNKHGTKSAVKESTVFDLIMGGGEPSAHPAETALINFMQNGKNDVKSLPIVPDPVSEYKDYHKKRDTQARSSFLADASREGLQLETHRNRSSIDKPDMFNVGNDRLHTQTGRTSVEKTKVAYSVDEIYKEADKLSDVGSHFRKFYAGKSVNQHNHPDIEQRYTDVNTIHHRDEIPDLNMDDSTRTLKDYDKRLSKSGIFTAKELKERPPTGEHDNARLNKSANNLPRNKEPLSMEQQHDRVGGRQEQSTRNPPDLLAKASLDTASEFIKPVFRDTFGTVKETNAAKDTDFNADFHTASYLTAEDHVEGIKQHVEIR